MKSRQPEHNERHNILKRLKNEASIRHKHLARARKLAREQYKKLGQRIQQPIIPPAG